MGPYKESFPKGSQVRVVSANRLEAFMQDWKYHHKLEPEQLQFAGSVATVKSVSFYHGGDPLYQLDILPGTWHETCLEALVPGGPQ
jgi:hypothetical protein